MGCIHFMLLVSLCVMSAGQPLDLSSKATIIAYSNVPAQNAYNFRYETSDGVARSEKGEFLNQVWVVTGDVSWSSPDGVLNVLRYTADDKGYRPTFERAQPSPSAAAAAEARSEDDVPVPMLRTLSGGTVASLLGV